MRCQCECVLACIGMCLPSCNSQAGDSQPCPHQLSLKTEAQDLFFIRGCPGLGKGTIWSSTHRFWRAPCSSFPPSHPPPCTHTPHTPALQGPLPSPKPRGLDAQGFPETESINPRRVSRKLNPWRCCPGPRIGSASRGPATCQLGGRRCVGEFLQLRAMRFSSMSSKTRPQMPCDRTPPVRCPVGVPAGLKALVASWC